MQQFLFCGGAPPSVYTADALHQTYRVPVELVIDETGSILQVQAFSEDISSYQNIDLIRHLRRGHIVVIRCKPLNQIMPAAFALTVNFIYMVKTFFLQFPVDIFCSCPILGEDDYFLPCDAGIFAKNAYKFSDLVIVFRLDAHDVLNELCQNFHIENGIVQHCTDIKIIHIQIFFGFPYVVRKIILQIINGRLNIVLDEFIDKITYGFFFSHKSFDLPLISIVLIIHHEFTQPRVDTDTGFSKCLDRAFESFQKQLPDQVNDLLLPSGLHYIDFRLIADKIGILVRRIYG